MRVAFHGHGNMATRETNGQTGQTSVWAKFIVSSVCVMCGPSCSCAIAPREQCNPRNATARTIHPLTYFYLERWFNALFPRALKEARSCFLFSLSLSVCLMCYLLIQLQSADMSRRISRFELEFSRPAECETSLTGFKLQRTTRRKALTCPCRLRQ